MPPDRYLIINADDLGLSPEINRGILDAVRRGPVTSVSLFVNPPHQVETGPFIDSGVSIGLHLNLTQGIPVSERDSVPSLVNPDGFFISDREKLLKAIDAGADPCVRPGRTHGSAPTTSVPSEAARELRLQLEAFREMVGKDPTHLDVHKHLHVHSGTLWEKAVEMALELGVPLRSLNDDMRLRCLENGVKTPDHFIGEVKPAPFWTLERMLEAIRNLPQGVTELMCHPGYSPGSIRGLWYLAQRETELETLTGGKVREALAGIRLVSFANAPFKILR